MEHITNNYDTVKTGGMRYVRFYPSDWRSDAIGLSVEQEGMLIRVSAYIYETGRMVPVDDSLAAKHLGMHTNAYRKLIGQLERLGHVIKTAGGWVSRRAADQFQTAAGRAVEDAIKAKPPTQAASPRGRLPSPNTIGVSGGVSGGVLQNTTQETPQETSHVFMGVCSEKRNDFNSRKTLPITNSQERESDRQSDSDAARVKSAFNGSTERMVDDVLQAMGPGCDRHHAETWLAGLLSTNGGEAVQQAWMMLQTHRAEGQAIVRVLPWWSKTASTLKAKGGGRKPAEGGQRGVYAVWKAQQEEARAAAGEGGGQ